jgi:hypothetical protein
MDMAKKLIVHAGFHKTGTTALQSALFANINELVKFGIEYPQVGGKAHHKAIYSLMGKTWGWEDRGGVTATDKKWKNLIRQVGKINKTALISSEFLCELNEEQITKFRNELNVADTHIYFTIRPLLKIIPSAYQQHLKIGIKSDYEKWLHSILDEPGVSTITPSFWVRHTHAKVISKWIAEFGADRVTLIVVDEAQPDVMYDTFSELLGLPAKFLKKQENQDSNRSLSLNEITMLNRINRQYPKRRSWHDYETFIRNGAIKYLTNKVEPAQDDLRLLTPQWAVDKAKEISANSVADIKKLGIHIIGDLDSFEDAKVLIGDNPVIKMIPVDLAAQALIALDLRVVETFPKKWILQKLWKMTKRDTKKWLKKVVKK